MTKLSEFCTNFIEWSILVVAALVPLIFNFSTIDNFSLPKIVFFRALVLLMLLAWIVKSIEEKKITFARSPLAAVILIFLAVNVLAAVFGMNPKVSFWGAYSKFQGLFTLLHLIVFFLILLSFIKNKKQLKRLVLVLIFASVPISIHAIFQHFRIDFMTSLSHTDIRAFSTLGSALHLGAYLIMIMPLTLAWTFSREKVWQKLMFGAIFVLQCFALLFTYTRSAWLGIAMGLIFFFLAWAVKQKSLRNTAAVSVGILFLILFCVSLFSRANILHLPKGNEFLERTASIFDLKSESNAQRLVVWQKSAEIIKTRPLLGYGTENFYYAFFKNYPPELTKFPEPNFDRAHNQVLDLGVTAGVLGIVSFLIVILAAFYYGFKILRKSQDKIIWGTALALSAGLLAYLIQNQFSFDSPAILVYFYLFVGLIAALDKSIMNETAKEAAASQKKGAVPNLPAFRKNFYSLFGLLTVIILAFLVWTNFFPYRADAIFKQALLVSDIETKEKLYGQAISMTPYKNYYRAELAQDYQLFAEQILKEKEDGVGAEKYFNLSAEELKKNIKGDPLDYQNYLDLGKFYTLWGKINSEKFILANESYQKSADASPSYQLIYWEWGDSLLAQNKKGEAIEKFNYAVSLDPAVGKSYYKLGEAYEKLGEQEKAGENFGKAESLGYIGQ